jgi:hypothetical protein
LGQTVDSAWVAIIWGHPAILPIAGQHPSLAGTSLATGLLFAYPLRRTVVPKSAAITLKKTIAFFGYLMFINIYLLKLFHYCYVKQGFVLYFVDYYTFFITKVFEKILLK